jgi:hypothetical protein
LASFLCSRNLQDLALQGCSRGGGLTDSLLGVFACPSPSLLWACSRSFELCGDILLGGGTTPTSWGPGEDVISTQSRPPPQTLTHDRPAPVPPRHKCPRPPQTASEAFAPSEVATTDLAPNARPVRLPTSPHPPDLGNGSQPVIINSFTESYSTLAPPKSS